MFSQPVCTLIITTKDYIFMDSVYEEFSRYDFESDRDYVAGLRQVMEQYLVLQSETDLEIQKDVSEGKLDFAKIKPADKEQLIWQAKVFFFCSKTGNILDLDDYKKWEAQKTETKPQDAEIPYSSNYEQLVDLIVNNKPIPGIKQIPDTVLGAEIASDSTLTERKKPWEVKTQESTATQINAPN
ncbi:hypothetical protein OGAPHI_001065 [Ogataea philodendri]|uniref:Uncharacterized protein n=1 Tax=Ogataea philodendri TaxID=1378263 RepID=A0A9P8T9Q6_9ASCO|nr:uncharacterized protein OGAPHI_001065 [Ogataea philodendri]KAH3670550.1 hypothetical protein OGAPHI_001065 [Ogataea philodendri]